MGIRARIIMLGVLPAAVLAVSGWGVSSAFGATGHAVKNAVEFKAEHVGGVKGEVLVEGRGLVVYTFTGDHRGKAGTCSGQCAAIWPLLRGTPEIAHGAKITGKFGTIHGQVTFNGWPLYLFVGEKPGHNHANSAFKVVLPQGPTKTKAPAPKPMPAPSSTSTGW